MDGQDEWRWSDPNGQQRTVHLDELRAGLASGAIPSNAPVWRSGWDHWRAAHSVAELGLSTSGSQPPPRYSNRPPGPTERPGATEPPSPPRYIAATKRTVPPGKNSSIPPAVRASVRPEPVADVPRPGLDPNKRTLVGVAPPSLAALYSALQPPGGASNAATSSPSSPKEKPSETLLFPTNAPPPADRSDADYRTVPPIVVPGAQGGALTLKAVTQRPPYTPGAISFAPGEEPPERMGGSTLSSMPPPPSLRTSDRPTKPNSVFPPRDMQAVKFNSPRTPGSSPPGPTLKSSSTPPPPGSSTPPPAVKSPPITLPAMKPPSMAPPAIKPLSTPPPAMKSPSAPTPPKSPPPPAPKAASTPPPASASTTPPSSVEPSADHVNQPPLPSAYPPKRASVSITDEAKVVVDENAYVPLRPRPPALQPASARRPNVVNDRSRWAAAETIVTRRPSMASVRWYNLSKRVFALTILIRISQALKISRQAAFALIAGALLSTSFLVIGILRFISRPSPIVERPVPVVTPPPVPTEAPKPKPAPREPVLTCSSVGAARRIAPTAMLAAGIEPASAGTRLALGYATSAKDGVVVEFEAQSLSITKTAKIHATDIVKKVLPTFANGKAWDLIPNFDKRSDSMQGRRTFISTHPVDFGVVDGQLTRAEHGSDKITPLWPLEGEWPVEALRAVQVSLPTGDPETVVVFRRAGALWLGWLTAASTPRGPLVRVASLGPQVGNPAIAASGDHVIVTWADRANATSPWSIRVLRWALGSAPTEPKAFNPPAGGPGGAVMSPSIAGIAQGDFLMVWTEGVSPTRQIRAVMVDDTGEPVGNSFVASIDGLNVGQGQAVINSDGDGFIGYLATTKGTSFELHAMPVSCVTKAN